MELMLGVVTLCVMAGAAGAMESDAPLDGGGGGGERARPESVTINRPAIRGDHRARHQPPALSRQGLVEEHVGLFDDDITGPPSASVRCFCNLPSCIATGYMCKSRFGGCFSDLLQRHAPASASRTAYRGRHGCIELLTDKAQRERCQRLPNGNRYPASARSASKSADDYDHPRSLVHCCHEDMCNHADNPQTKDLINDTTLDDLEESRVVGSQMNTGYSDSDVWFKAATIAVPICGAVILFVLIALACRLLKTESLNHTNYKLGCTYLHGKHGHSCAKHHDRPYCQPVAAEPFLRKDQMAREYPLPPRRSIPAPIILTKNINATNSKQYNYNLLPVRNNNEVRVHEMVPKCYDNKISSYGGPSSLPAVYDENPVVLQEKLNNLQTPEDTCDISKVANNNVNCNANVAQAPPHEETRP